ncbi:hypothetical protein BN2537_15511 [Streptomyces venezuelae]|nr:hypothetical protein BN2537_15511 [Streptomyces venezuelae]
MRRSALVSLVSKIVVAAGAGTFLAVSAAGVQPPRPASPSEPDREVVVDERHTAPGPGRTGATPGATGAVPSPSPSATDQRSP